MEPTLHSVSVFQNEVIDVWILLEKKYSEGKWRRYALIQDKTIEPNVAHYFQWAFDGSGTLVRRGATCYQCHTSGPRAMREVRADLLVGKRYAEQMNRYVRQLDFVETRFSEAEPRADFGPALAIDACTQCHGRDAQRGPLYPLHRLTIETLLDRGAMPPDSCPSAAERAAIRTWLDGWFDGQTQSDEGEVVANPKDA
jgi:mono/diheme cytochrome c family protein